MSPQQVVMVIKMLVMVIAMVTITFVEHQQGMSWFRSGLWWQETLGLNPVLLLSELRTYWLTSQSLLGKHENSLCLLVLCEQNEITCEFSAHTQNMKNIVSIITLLGQVHFFFFYIWSSPKCCHNSVVNLIPQEETEAQRMKKLAQSHLACK